MAICTPWTEAEMLDAVERMGDDAQLYCCNLAQHKCECGADFHAARVEHGIHSNDAEMRRTFTEWRLRRHS